MSGTPPPSSSKNVLKRKKSSLAEIRITFLGDRDVGKTAMVVRFITRRFIVDYDKGSDSKYRHELQINNETVQFDFLDSSSPITLNIKRFDFASHETDLFLVVYSITDRQSFHYVRNLLKHLVQLKTNGMQNPLVAIVGNKLDMIHSRQVSQEEAEILTTEFSELTVGYFGEWSVANQMVNQLFTDIYIWAKRQKIAAKTGQTLNDRLCGGKSSPSSVSSNSL